VHKGVHTLQLADVTTYDVPWDNTADELDHTVSNTAGAVDGEDGIGVIGAIDILVVCANTPSGGGYDRGDSDKIRGGRRGEALYIPSAMRRIAVSKPNAKMALARTDRVLKRLMRGAMRMAPTHCIAWFKPCKIPTFSKALLALKRSVARVVMDPLNCSAVGDVKRQVKKAVEIPTHSSPNL